MRHKNIRHLPTVTEEIMDSFVKKQPVAKETSVRGYKPLLESYVHDMEGAQYC